MKLPSPLRLSNWFGAASGASPAPGRDSWGAAVGADAELERMLETFAEAALSPEAETLTRGRAAMLSAVALRTEAATEAEQAAQAQPAGMRREPLRSKLTLRGPGRGRAMDSFAQRRTSLRPRFVALGTAVALLLVTVIGAAAESGPGQPFYRVRLDVEAIGLPAAGSTARAQADLSRAKARVSEISGKAAGNDWNAAADAADAYEQLLATMASPAPNKTNDAYRQGLRDQLNHLLALRGKSQGKESKALDNVIARLESLLGLPPSTTPAPAPTDKPGKGHGNGNGNGNGGDNSGAGDGGATNGNGNGNGGNGNGNGNGGGNGH